MGTVISQQVVRGSAAALTQPTLRETFTLLVVEDEPEILEPLVYSLRREGYRLLVAQDGLDACRLIGAERPDLVLLDIMLPRLDGWEICSLLRRHPDQSVADTPVVMLTALSGADQKFRGLQLGADAFLPKPYAIRELLLIVANLLRRRQQTVQLADRLQALERRDSGRDNLHGLLFHELRNQLSILSGYAQLLGSGREEDAECLDAINRSSEYLNGLAHDLFLIRTLEKGESSLQKEGLVLGEILDEIVGLYAAPARDKGLRIDLSLDPGSLPVAINRPALKIILSTLIDNALKYGGCGKTVSVCCHRVEETVEILVADQGAGLAENERVRIFEPFYRGGAASSTVDGSGLGLHSVRVLARALGGDVTLEPCLGRGCCFRVSLPVGL